MAASKAEVGLWIAGGLAVAGAFVFRKRLADQAFANALIFGAGTLGTAGIMTGYRVTTTRTTTALAHPNLGLALTEQHDRDGKTLKVWDDTEMGIRHRVHLLQGLVAESVKNPEVRKLALSITGHGDRTIRVAGDDVDVRGAACAARDDICEAEAIFNWVANPKNVRYTGDVGPHALGPNGPVEAVDQFQSALRTIEFRGGDCDDHAVVNATLGAQNGFPVIFRITSNEGDTWDHIYTMFGVPKLDPKKWIAMDTTLGPGKFNIQPSRAKQVDFAA